MPAWMIAGIVFGSLAMLLVAAWIYCSTATMRAKRSTEMRIVRKVSRRGDISYDRQGKAFGRWINVSSYAYETTAKDRMREALIQNARRAARLKEARKPGGRCIVLAESKVKANVTIQTLVDKATAIPLGEE